MILIIFSGFCGLGSLLTFFVGCGPTPPSSPPPKIPPKVLLLLLFIIIIIYYCYCYYYLLLLLLLLFVIVIIICYCYYYYYLLLLLLLLIDLFSGFMAYHANRSVLCSWVHIRFLSICERFPCFCCYKNA
jgi:hypothetical protein